MICWAEWTCFNFVLKNVNCPQLHNVNKVECDSTLKISDRKLTSFILFYKSYTCVTLPSIITHSSTECTRTLVLPYWIPTLPSILHVSKTTPWEPTLNNFFNYFDTVFITLFLLPIVVPQIFLVISGGFVNH